MSLVPRGIALIFDMDGVIVDSTAIHVDAWEEYLLSRSIRIDDIRNRMLGRHNSEIVRSFIDPDLDEAAVAAHGAAKEALYRDKIHAQLDAKLVPGMRRFLADCAGAPMGIATNAEAANVDFILQNASIAGHFQAIVSADDVARPKPYPDAYQRAAELLETPARNCVAFEDSRGGVQAARAAGMRVVGVTTTLDSFADVDLTIPDFLSANLRAWISELELRG